MRGSPEGMGKRWFRETERVHREKGKLGLVTPRLDRVPGNGGSTGPQKQAGDEMGEIVMEDSKESKATTSLSPHSL